MRDRLAQTRQRLLDAGCGAGGFLRWARTTGAFDEVAGVDVASAAIDLARRRVPEADLRVAALAELPFEPGSFDVVVTNDVLQHIPLDDVSASVRELRRVLTADGT
ncbi:MAG: class I SAM-dependent methyltransferase, partial [Gemmatimonadota bacterium]|nr:class I SAM-dependent methyltransferase [Gemmatimonadota bacterium]